MQLEGITSHWGEEWRDFEIKDLTDKFKISNRGRIVCFDKRTEKWKLQKLYNGKKDGSDYDFLTITRQINGKKRRFSKLVHRLVADAYCKKEHKGQRFVIHLNFIKTNNQAGNLKWVTQKELTEHNSKNPKVIAAKSKPREKPGNAKLTETEVIRIKKRLLRGKRRLYKIAEEFGITHTQLNRIRHGVNWKHVKVDA
jgi:hypothetical protein